MGRYDYDEENRVSLSDEEIAIVNTDFTEAISDDSIEELEYLVDNYFKLDNMSTDVAEEEEAVEYVKNVINDILREYPVPAEEYGYLFKFCLTVEKIKSQHSSSASDIIFDSRENPEGLFARVEEYLNENPELFRNAEIYDLIWEYDDALKKTRLFKNTLKYYYDDILAMGGGDAIMTLVSLYNEDKPLSKDYLERCVIPEEPEEFHKAFAAISNSNKKGKAIERLYPSVKQIILDKYSAIDEYAQWLQMQNTEETRKKAKKYKTIKWVSFIAGIVMVPLYIGIVILVLWVVMYFTKVHDKISFLRDGKAAVEATKNQ